MARYGDKFESALRVAEAQVRAAQASDLADLLERAADIAEGLVDDEANMRIWEGMRPSR